MTTVISKPGTSILVEERSDIMPNGVPTTALSPGDIVSVARTVAPSDSQIAAGEFFVSEPITADLHYAIANGVVMQTIRQAASNGKPSFRGLIKWSGAYVKCNVDGSGTAIVAGDPLMIVNGGRRLVKATTGLRIVAIALEASTSATGQIFCLFKGQFGGLGKLA